jgi:prephenate dehydratase
MYTIYYLGPSETFTEQAAKNFANLLDAQTPDISTLVPQPTLTKTITAVHSPEQFAVVPYYNLIEGLIQETLDLLVEHQLVIDTAHQIPVRFALGGFLPGSNGYESFPSFHAEFADNPAAALTVYSHPKALAQCTDFLQAHYPAAAFFSTSSTAEGVRLIAEKRTGLAVARREALEKNRIPVLHDDIGNRQYSRQNYTEFLLVGMRENKICRVLPVTEHERTLIAIIPTVDRVGLLADILGQIAFFGINLLKVHSRPALTEVRGQAQAPQMFYLEMDIAADSPELQLCIETLNMRLAKKGEIPDHRVVQILGSYYLHACQESNPIA